MTTEANLQKEIWKPIKGYEGIYEVSSLGRVKSLKRVSLQKHLLPERILKSRYDKDGYSIVNIRRNGHLKVSKIHRLVAITFLLNPGDKPQVNHINGIKDDNRLSNLEWATPSENMRHSYDTGLSNHKGERNGQCKLTELDVLSIRTNKYSLTQRELANQFNVSEGQISNIVNRRLWQHI